MHHRKNILAHKLHVICTSQNEAEVYKDKCCCKHELIRRLPLEISDAGRRISVRWSVFRIEEIVGAPSLVTTFTAVLTPWPHGFFLICISITPSTNCFTDSSFCGDEGPFTCYRKDMHLFVRFINNFNAENIYSIGSR